MLVVREIKENFQQFVVGLNKRGFLGVEKRLKEIIELDNQRKEVQIALDETLNRSNELSKKIGVLIKDGNREEAKKIKLETSEIKGFGKNLSIKLQGIDTLLRDKLYELPNIPNVKVTDVNHFSAFDIVKFKKVVFTESSIKELEKRYS